MSRAIADTRVRLADVAEVAGVSMKTVSNVVHDYPHVSPQVRSKVQSAIDALGYHPNITARRLATGLTGMVALAMPWIDTPYFAELSRHIAEEAAKVGYRVLVEQTANSVEAEKAVLRDREQGLVDGVIFHPVRLGAIEITKLQPNIPLVLLGESAIPLTTDHVMIDNVKAAREAVELLVAQGRRRIAFLATVSDDVTGSTQLRLVGYQEALIEAGLPLDPSLVLSSDGWPVQNAVHALRTAVHLGIDIDAVLCRDDTFAMGALAALAAEGRSVPDDVAVIGWDDTILARYSTPSLSTVAPDKVGIAATALRLLDERIHGHVGIGRHEIAGHSVIERATTSMVI